MSGWWFGCILVVCCFTVVNSREDIKSALTLAHCRASCIHEMDRPVSHMTQQRCRQSIECSQCWDVCSRLQGSDSIEPVCTNKQCTGGCLKACKWVSTGHSPLVLITRPSEELTILGTCASWPSRGHTTLTPVYVVMVDHQLYLQTLDLTATLPLAVDPMTVQVLVVDWRGLTEVFTPRPQSPLEQARTLVRRLGLEKTLDLKDSFNVTRNQVTAKKPWNLKEVFREYQQDLANIHISWEPQQLAPTTDKLTYLVTWLVEGGMVRGNLVTNTSSAILSLQLDTVFRIQVALFTLNSTDWESEFLDVDTHNILEKSHFTSISQPVLLHPSTKNPRLVSFLTGGVAIFLVVVLVLTWRWQQGVSLRHSKLVDEEIGAPKLYRVFPPAVRLISDNMEGNYDLFSSRDNLLQN